MMHICLDVCSGRMASSAVCQPLDIIAACRSSKERLYILSASEPRPRTQAYSEQPKSTHPHSNTKADATQKTQLHFWNISAYPLAISDLFFYPQSHHGQRSRKDRNRSSSGESQRSGKRDQKSQANTVQPSLTDAIVPRLPEIPRMGSSTHQKHRSFETEGTRQDPGRRQAQGRAVGDEVLT